MVNIETIFHFYAPFKSFIKVVSTQNNHCKNTPIKNSEGSIMTNDFLVNQAIMTLAIIVRNISQKANPKNLLACVPLPGTPNIFLYLHDIIHIYLILFFDRLRPKNCFFLGLTPEGFTYKVIISLHN